jgi:hypothetical protein
MMRPWTTSLQTLARGPLPSPRTLPARKFPSILSPGSVQIRSFTQTVRYGQKDLHHDYNNTNARPAEDLNHNITQEEKDDWARKVQEDKIKQIRTPWHREGSEKPPVARQRVAGAMTKGNDFFSPFTRVLPGAR